MSFSRFFLEGRWALAAVLLLLAVAPILAQQMLDPANPETPKLMRQIDNLLESNKPDTLSCDLREIDPWLNFAFRWHAGYRVEFPLGQFPPEPSGVRVVFRVKPVSGDGGYYFWQDFNIPAGARAPRQYGRVNGGYFLGEGNYEVAWMMLDGNGRSCRKRWDVKLALNGEQRRTAHFLPPKTAAPIVLTWEGAAGSTVRPYRIAVILHVSPIFPRSTRITAVDESFLLTMLTSLLEETPFRETSVKAINLNQQREIFSTTELDPFSFENLMESMRKLQLGAIDIDQYSNPDGGAELLARLVNDEVAAEEPPDAIVFIGPNNRHTRKFPSGLIESTSGKKPLFFYLHLDYYARRFPWSDTIQRLTKSQHGKTFTIRRPEQLARAIKKMREMLDDANPQRELTRARSN